MQSSPVLAPPINIACVMPDNSSTKRCRGQPMGFEKSRDLASVGGYFAEIARGNFSPHVVTVPIREDLAGTILSVFRRSSHELRVLSLVGRVSNVVLCQSDSLTTGLKFELLVYYFQAK
ncbi:hypothetical protein JRO89_XS10G0184500 [Xanthoceras sorbifolium]|uniref:AT-hook motif nuclear-localized protein n=1 Tax=Xanthoceras sorbifolium TaxID=99658 RepID=A0ABQ8HJF0_9ROSI|nr:hypothetical protein JRO89_XS10G0184500 [Xanthoceras sorbifolium]